MNELQNLNLLWLKRITNAVLSINVSIIMSLNNEALNNIKCYIGSAPPIMSSKLIIDVIHFTVFVNIFFLNLNKCWRLDDITGELRKFVISQYFLM